MLLFELYVLRTCITVKKKRYKEKKMKQHHSIIVNDVFITEDWSNDPENLALITGIKYILKYIQIENSYFKLQ